MFDKPTQASCEERKDYSGEQKDYELKEKRVILKIFFIVLFSSSSRMNAVLRMIFKNKM
mgnify:CR=1 FL=1